MSAVLPRRLPALPAWLPPVLLLLLAWEVAARALSGLLVLAGPWEVVSHAAANAGLLWRALRATALAAGAGFLLGNAAAVALALAALLAPRAERTLSALALLVFCLPFVATGPILRVLLGPGVGPQVALAALAVFYTTYVPLLVGLRAAPAGWLDLVRSYGRGRGAELAHVRARAAAPYLVAGLQIAAPAAVLGAMVGEFTGAERGLGVLTIRAMRNLDPAATWAVAALAAGLSMAVYAAVGGLGRRLSAGPPPVILAPPATARRGGARGLALAALLALGLWWAAMEALGLSPFFAKRPGDVWAFLVAAPDAARDRAALLAALWQTMTVTVPGYAAGLAVGAGAAAVLTLSPRLAALTMPVAVTLRSVPIVATAPLVVLALGRGPLGVTALVALMIFFPALVACLHGLRQAPGQVVDVFESYAAGRWRRLLLAQVPAMAPAFFAAARMSVPAAVLAATVAEWLATGTGIGSLMALSASLSDYDALWASIVLVALSAVVLHAGVARIERAVLARLAPEQLA